MVRSVTDGTTILQTPRITRGDSSIRNTCPAEIKQGEVPRDESTGDGVTRHNCFNRSQKKKFRRSNPNIRNSRLYNSVDPKSLAVVAVESQSHGGVTGAIVIVFNGG